MRLPNELLVSVCKCENMWSVLFSKPWLIMGRNLKMMWNIALDGICMWNPAYFRASIVLFLELDLRETIIERGKRENRLICQHVISSSKYGILTCGCVPLLNSIPFAIFTSNNWCAWVCFGLCLFFLSFSIIALVTVPAILISITFTNANKFNKTRINAMKPNMRHQKHIANEHVCVCVWISTCSLIRMQMKKKIGEKSGTIVSISPHTTMQLSFNAVRAVAFIVVTFFFHVYPSSGFYCAFTCSVRMIIFSIRHSLAITRGKNTINQKKRIK